MRDGHAVHFARSCELRSGVEAEPSEPKDEHTQGCHRQVVTRNSAALAVLAILADTGTKGQGTNQSQYTAHAMHNGRTGKIVEHITKGRHHKAVGCIVAEPAATPGPVTFDGVDEQRDDCTIDEIHRELGALGHGTAHDGGRGGTEHRLENQETLNGQIAFVETQVAPVGHADKTSQRIASEHEAEAEEEEQERAEHKVDKVLHQDVGRVLTTRKTCFTQRKARLHPENQHGCQ